jgi:tetratricopeptide (TPR) repeat protein
LCRGGLALTSRTKSAQDWATTQTNLGLALQSLGIRSGGSEGREQLEAAVAAYRSALEVYSKEQLPQDWAATQNNLGAALKNLGIRSGGSEQLEAAVAAYRSALEVRTKEQLPQQWAMTQKNLAFVLTQFAELSTDENRPELLEEAARVYENVIAASEEGVLERSSAADLLGSLSFLKLKSGTPQTTMSTFIPASSNRKIPRPCSSRSPTRFPTNRKSR